MSHFLLIVGVVLLALVRADRSLEGFMRHRSWQRRPRKALVVTAWIAAIGFMGYWVGADIDACIEEAKGDEAEIEECRS